MTTTKTTTSMTKWNMPGRKKIMFFYTLPSSCMNKYPIIITLAHYSSTSSSTQSNKCLRVVIHLVCLALCSCGRTAWWLSILSCQYGRQRRQRRRVEGKKPQQPQQFALIYLLVRHVSLQHWLDLSFVHASRQWPWWSISITIPSSEREIWQQKAHNLYMRSHDILLHCTAHASNHGNNSIINNNNNKNALAILQVALWNNLIE